MFSMGEEEGGELSCQVALKTRPRNNIKNTPKIHIYVYIYIYITIIFTKTQQKSQTGSGLPPRAHRVAHGSYGACVCVWDIHTCVYTCVCVHIFV